MLGGVTSLFPRCAEMSRLPKNSIRAESIEATRNLQSSDNMGNSDINWQKSEKVSRLSQQDNMVS